MLPKTVLESLQKLSTDDLKKVAEFIQRLQCQPSVARVNPRGLFRDRAAHLSAEDINQARREVWANFPRDLPGSSTQ